MNAQRDIAVFVRVVDLGSFAAVAEEAGLTATGVSKAVTRLESRLGVKLLSRSTRRLALTHEGETFLARGREILAASEAAEAEVSAGSRVPRGLLRVNTGTAFAKHRLARLLPTFQASHPGITVELSVTDRRVDPIADQIDVTIRVGPLGDSALVAARLGEVRRIIVASPAYLERHGTPRRAADLLNHNCLLLTGFARLAKWPMVEDGKRVLLPVTGSISCDSADLLLDFAIAGVGIVRLGDFLGLEALADGRLVPLLADCHDESPSPINALMPPGRQTLPRVRAFVDFLRESMRRDAAPTRKNPPTT